MSEAQRLVALNHRAHARGERLCLATVVQVEGSAYRKPGARMLITSGGERAGTISGGCLETEVSRKAWWLTAHGARIERYSSFADEDGALPYGLGCGGTISLLLEQGKPVEAVLTALDRVLTTRQPAIVITALGQVPGVAAPIGTTPTPLAGTFAVLAPQTLGSAPTTPVSADFNPTTTLAITPVTWDILYLRSELNQPPDSPASHAGQPTATLPAGLAAAARVALSQRLSCLLTHRFLPCSARLQPSSQPADAPAYFLEYLAPPPAVTIFGAGDDAQPIAELAHTLGWRITIADGRAHLARRDRFPRAAEVRVLVYNDPALRAACGLALDTTDPDQASLAEPWPPATTHHRPWQPSPLPQAAPAPHPESLFSGLLFQDELAIILTHSYEQDRALLAALLPRRLRYLGILGPRHRTQRLLSEVAPSLGLSIDEAFARLHSPIGLDLGAGDPATVALSILAEIQAVLQSRDVHIARTGDPLALPLAGD